MHREEAQRGGVRTENEKRSSTQASIIEHENEKKPCVTDQESIKRTSVVEQGSRKGADASPPNVQGGAGYLMSSH